MKELGPTQFNFNKEMQLSPLNWEKSTEVWKFKFKSSKKKDWKATNFMKLISEN